MTDRSPRIAVFRGLPPATLQALARLGEVQLPAEGAVLRGEAAGRHLANADAALVTPFDSITDEMLAQAPNLRCISSIGAGLDHIDLAACERRGVKVSNAPEATTEPTADLAFALLLGAARRLTAADAFVRSGQWVAGAAPFWGLDAHHRTLGIVGMGRIGLAIARRARAFSMDVLYHNRRPVSAEALQGVQATWSQLDDLLARSDFVILQAPLTAQTRHMIGARELKLMKPTAILVNTGRGGLVEEGALAEALTKGVIAQAALDVFEGEPAVDPRLLECPNLILAPHIGTATTASRAEMADLAVANLARLLGAG